MRRAGEEVMNLFTYLRTYLRSFVRNEEGQDLLEYALLVALIAIVCVAAVTTAGENVDAIFTQIGTDLATALD
jgi:pilus assembly protein Flp/PilA